jgi:hypothetical protein
MRFPDGTPRAAEPRVLLFLRTAKSRRRLESIGDGLSQMGMIRNPRSM